MITVGIVLFEDMEELDAIGPWEVFGSTAQVRDDLRVVGVAESSEPVRCAKGLRLIPDHAFDQAPELDVMLVPGGQGSRREVDNPAMLEFVRRQARHCRWTTSVCTGALVLCGAGLCEGRRVTTHWAFLEELQRRYPDVEVLSRRRYVRDGALVTAAGVSAGIDMALWLVGQLFDVDTARRVQHYMEYDPAPPYAAEV